MNVWFNLQNIWFPSHSSYQLNPIFSYIEFGKATSSKPVSGQLSTPVMLQPNLRGHVIKKQNKNKKKNKPLNILLSIP